MIVDKNFNKRGAPQIECSPVVKHGRGSPRGLCATFMATYEQSQKVDVGDLQVHMTPDEAIEFGLNLIAAARARLKADSKI